MTTIVIEAEGHGRRPLRGFSASSAQVAVMPTTRIAQQRVLLERPQSAAANRAIAPVSIGTATGSPVNDEAHNAYSLPARISSIRLSAAFMLCDRPISLSVWHEVQK